MSVIWTVEEFDSAGCYECVSRGGKTGGMKFGQVRKVENEPGKIYCPKHAAKMGSPFKVRYTKKG